MKTILIFLILAAFSSTALALTRGELGMKHPELAYVYQQSKFMEKDLLGDILLAKSVQKVPVGLAHILIGRRGEYYSKPYIEAFRLAKIYPKMSRINGEDAVYLEKAPEPRNHYPLNLEMMKKAFEKVLLEGNAHRGSVPTWSAEYKKNYHNKIIPGVVSSKLLLCLMRGVCARFMLTGQEKKLEEWSMRRKDLTINPEILFKKALEFSQGNVSMALLTCHNLLSWHSKAPDRWKTQLQAKLRPFKTAKGELSEDKFGEWYHLFGLMTYGFVKGPVRASYIGTIESYGGRAFHNFKAEVVEEKVNSIGPKLAKHLGDFF